MMMKRDITIAAGLRVSLSLSSASFFLIHSRLLFAIDQVGWYIEGEAGKDSLCASVCTCRLTSGHTEKGRGGLYSPICITIGTQWCFIARLARIFSIPIRFSTV